MTAKHGRERRAPLGVATVVFLALAGLTAAAYFSPIFDVRTIRVQGNRLVSDVEIMRLGGVSEGDPLLRLSADDIGTGLSRNPWIADVLVQRSLPSTLILKVRERRPAAWVQDGDGVIRVAGDGTLLDRLAHPPAELPSLGGLQEAVAPGDRVDGLAGALLVAASLPRELREAVRLIVQDHGEVILRLRRGGEVRYGRPASMPEKNEALVSMLAWVEERSVRIEYIDVRVPDSPVLKPRG